MGNGAERREEGAEGAGCRVWGAGYMEEGDGWRMVEGTEEGAGRREKSRAEKSRAEKRRDDRQQTTECKEDAGEHISQGSTYHILQGGCRGEERRTCTHLEGLGVLFVLPLEQLASSLGLGLGLGLG